MVYLNLQNVYFLLKGFCILRSATRSMVKTYNCSCNRNMCLWWCSNVYKRLQSFIWRYFYCAFLGSSLGIFDSAMCSPGWGNLVAFDWNDLPVGREFYGKFLKNIKSPPYALRRPLFLPSKQQSFSLKNICEFMFNGPDQLNTGCAGGSSKGKAWNAIVSLLPSYVPTWRSGDETARRVEVVEGPEFEPGR